jgi:hypothetical protein
MNSPTDACWRIRAATLPECRWTLKTLSSSSTISSSVAESRRSVVVPRAISAWAPLSVAIRSPVVKGRFRSTRSIRSHQGLNSQTLPLASASRADPVRRVDGVGAAGGAALGARRQRGAQEQQGREDGDEPATSRSGGARRGGEGSFHVELRVCAARAATRR